MLGAKLPLDRLPVLAIGGTPLSKSNVTTAIHAHGIDGLGGIHQNGELTAPIDWEAQLVHSPSEDTDHCRAFRATDRDAADEILFQLQEAAVDSPGNVTPLSEFNFYADPEAADTILEASKGFQLLLKGYCKRLDHIEQGKQAPVHIVVNPLKCAENDIITFQEYKEYIAPLKTPISIDFLPAYMHTQAFYCLT
ncbi:hypothetical protein BJV82DRAFT_665677 [Fennellomyces sp. T-0311]|nr:hypothetical protein BJV82DRAFT_665677 [Fennellomyces sp. T-0311]